MNFTNSFTFIGDGPVVPMHLFLHLRRLTFIFDAGESR